MNRTLQILGSALVASALTISGLRAQSTNLIDVQMAGTYGGVSSTNAVGAAVLGNSGDIWNEYGNNTWSGGYSGSSAVNLVNGTSSGASFAVSVSASAEATILSGNLPAGAANGFTATTGAPTTTVANLFSGSTQIFIPGNPSFTGTVNFTFSNLTAYLGDSFTYDVYYGGAGTSSSLTGATGGNSASSLSATGADANINNGTGDAYVQYTGTINASTLTFSAAMRSVTIQGNGWAGTLVGAQLQLVDNSAPISSFLWSNSPTDGNWSEGTNWAGGAAPTTNAALVFATSSITTVNNDFTGSNASFASISFSSNASAYTVNGNPLTIGYQGLANASSNNQVINAAISGIGSVNESGTGTLTLTPGTSNSYTGGNTIGTNGTLVGDSTSIQGTVNDNGKLILSQATNGTASGISGTGSVAVSGAGTLTLSGVNSYSGGTALNGASVAVNAGGIGSGTVTFYSNSTIRDIATGGITLSNPMVVTNGVNATLDAGTNGAARVELTLTGGISGSGAVTFAATTTNWVTIYENNSYSGGTTLNGGIIQWVGSTTPTPFGSGNVTVATNSYLRGINIVTSGGSVVLTNAITINSGVTLTLTNAGFAYTFSGPISGPGSLAVGSSGAYTTTLSASNSYTGATMITAGTLVLSGGASISESTNINVGTLPSPGSLDASANSLLLLGTNQTLSGNGTVKIGTGVVTVNGNLTPGSIDGTTVGKITTAGNLTLGSTAVTTLTLVTNGTAGVNYDAVAVTNTLTFDGSLKLVVNNTPSVGTYDLFTATAISGDFTAVGLFGTWNPGSFAETAPNTWTYSDPTFQWTFDSANGQLAVSAVPEASNLALLGLGLLLSLITLKRLNRKQENAS